MKTKTLIILALLILIPTLCFAGALQEKHRSVIAKKNVAAAPSCVKNATPDTNQSSSDSGSAIYSTAVLGQSFQVSAEKGLYSIVVYGWDVTTAGNIEMRIGTSANLSSSYLATDTVEISTVASYEFVFDEHPVLSTETTYYFGLGVASGASSNIEFALYGASSIYSGGSVFYGTWNMDDGPYTRDLKFQVYLCE